MRLAVRGVVEPVRLCRVRGHPFTLKARIVAIAIKGEHAGIVPEPRPHLHVDPQAADGDRKGYRQADDAKCHTDERKPISYRRSDDSKRRADDCKPPLATLNDCTQPHVKTRLSRPRALCQAINRYSVHSLSVTDQAANGSVSSCWSDRPSPEGEGFDRRLKSAKEPPSVGSATPSVVRSHTDAHDSPSPLPSESPRCGPDRSPRSAPAPDAPPACGTSSRTRSRSATRTPYAPHVSQRTASLLKAPPKGGGFHPQG